MQLRTSRLFGTVAPASADNGSEEVTRGIWRSGAGAYVLADASRGNPEVISSQSGVR